MVQFALGSVALHRHEPAEALPYFEHYARLRPEDPRGRFALGIAHFYSGQFEAARADLQAVVARPETAAGANYFLARIARQANDPAEARARIDEALRLNPSHADGWAELGLLQTRAGQYAEAERSLQKALTLDPANYLATVNLAALYTRTRDPRLASQQARLAALQQQRERQSQDFLRIIQVVPE
jgi:tetratricopeptide (TPR) repeat protein